jgi:hypothetical protein
MTADRLLIGSVLCLALGLGLIFGYCHGGASFSAAYPVGGASLQVSLTTTGMPAMAGFALTVVGLLLLIWAVVDAIVRHIELRAEMTRQQKSLNT